MILVTIINRKIKKVDSLIKKFYKNSPIGV